MRKLITKPMMIVAILALGLRSAFAVTVTVLHVQNDTSQTAYVKWGDGTLVNIPANQGKLVESQRRGGMPTNLYVYASNSQNPPFAEVQKKSDQYQSIVVTNMINGQNNIVTLTEYNSVTHRFSGNCSGVNCF